MINKVRIVLIVLGISVFATAQAAAQKIVLVPTVYLDQTVDAVDQVRGESMDAEAKEVISESGWDQFNFIEAKTKYEKTTGNELGKCDKQECLKALAQASGVDEALNILITISSAEKNTIEALLVFAYGAPARHVKNDNEATVEIEEWIKTTIMNRLKTRSEELNNKPAPLYLNPDENNAAKGANGASDKYALQTWKVASIVSGAFTVAALGATLILSGAAESAKNDYLDLPEGDRTTSDWEPYSNLVAAEKALFVTTMVGLAATATFLIILGVKSKRQKKEQNKTATVNWFVTPLGSVGVHGTF